jgi:hypothetical protein
MSKHAFLFTLTTEKKTKDHKNLCTGSDIIPVFQCTDYKLDVFGVSTIYFCTKTKLIISKEQFKKTHHHNKVFFFFFFKKEP